MPDSPVISGVADLPKFYFAEGAPFRLTLTIGAEFSMTGKFVTFGMRARSGTVRRVFGTDSGESNLTIAGQVITLDIATSAATVPAFASGWTLEDVQTKGETEYWVDISATEGSDVLLRLQGQADWVAPGSDIAESSAVVASPSIDVTITSGAVSASVAVLGAAEPTLTTNTVTSGLSGILKAASNTLEVATAGTDYVATNDSRLTDARTPTSHVHGGISNAGAIGSTSGLPIKTGTSGVLEVGAFGTSAGQFAQGNDSRFHDRSHAMTSTSDHTAGNWKVFHSNGSGQLVELALGADGTYLKSNGASAAPTFATPAGGGSSITGTGFAYVRTGGDNATAVIGDPSKPYSTGQAAWAAGATRFDFGPGSFSIDASYAFGAPPGAIYIQGVGSESIVTLTWRGQDVVDAEGVDSPTLNLYSDKSAVIDLTISGGNASSEIGSFTGGDVGNYNLYNCYIDTLTVTPGTGNFANGSDAASASAEFTTIVTGALEAGTISRNGVFEEGVFYPSPISDGDKGDIIVSSNGTSWTLQQNGVAFGYLQQASAKGKIIGRKTVGVGNFEECDLSDFMQIAATTSNIVDSTGVLFDVSGMSFTIAANEKVTAIFRGFWASNLSGSGLKYSFTGPGSPTVVQIGDIIFTSASAIRSESGLTAFNSVATQTAAAAINTPLPLMIQIYVEAGASGGTVQLQMCGETAATQNFTLYRGFTMQVLRIQ